MRSCVVQPMKASRGASFHAAVEKLSVARDFIFDKQFLLRTSDGHSNWSQVCGMSIRNSGSGRSTNHCLSSEIPGRVAKTYDICSA